MRRLFWIVFIGSFLAIGGLSFVASYLVWLFVPVGLLFAFGVVDFFQHKHAIRRNFPLLGRFRYWLEMIRPEINQYFIESNSDGVPFSREQRSVVYQRAKHEIDTLPFGSQLNQYASGYEWVSHSINTKTVSKESLRTLVGGPDCQQPYDCSLFNVSAMSFGSLSRQAVEALSAGAKLGGFAVNTGEGGLSPYHLNGGGDIIWQIGTGYFGCRTLEGKFDADRFAQLSKHPQIKMIEIKISQGAKPGHGGILPGGKVTQEISQIRGVPIGKDVLSPPTHAMFSNPKELIEFIAQLRELSGGKPIGIKLCIGKRREFIAICKAIVERNSGPDYIAVDGGEGGTGAAPLEFSNHIGVPSLEGLVFVHNCLKGFGLRKKIKVFSAGKVISAFDFIKRLALGADVVYAARSFMLSLGCIQALRCNTNHCPAGVATQDPQLAAGLVVTDKKVRVRGYHHETLDAAAHMMGAMGISHPTELRPWHIMRRINHSEIRNYGELVESLKDNCLLKEETLPSHYARAWKASSSNTFDNVLSETHGE
ncbi:MAG: FMN-binding glutamate synthase family protein [Bdellovibrionales bacterium]|nr:FMN-binding glutamate synthase family protein [Bdellovibrionales bacterium]